MVLTDEEVDRHELLERKDQETDDQTLGDLQLCPIPKEVLESGFGGGMFQVDGHEDTSLFCCY